MTNSDRVILKTFFDMLIENEEIETDQRCFSITKYSQDRFGFSVNNKEPHVMGVPYGHTTELDLEDLKTANSIKKRYRLLSSAQEMYKRLIEKGYYLSYGPCGCSFSGKYGLNLYGGPHIKDILEYPGKEVELDSDGKYFLLEGQARRGKPGEVETKWIDPCIVEEYDD